jgi:hypothetical protein
MLPPAQDQLAPDAVPFPLCQPVGDGPQLLRRLLDLVGEVEGVGARQVGGRVMRLDEAAPCHGVGRPVAHQPVGQFRLRDAGGEAEGAGHEFLAHAHAPAPRKELVEHQPLARRETLPRLEDRGLSRRLVGGVERAEPADPCGKRQVRLRRGFGQHQSDGLREVAHRGIARLEQPERDARPLRRPFTQLSGRDGAARAAAGEEGDAPEAVLLRRLPEVVRQRLGLGLGGGRLIERGEEGGEAFHAVRSLRKAARRATAASAAGARPA